MLFEFDFHTLSNLVRFYKTKKKDEFILFMCNFFQFLGIIDVSNNCLLWTSSCKSKKVNMILLFCSWTYFTIRPFC